MSLLDPVVQFFRDHVEFVHFLSGAGGGLVALLGKVLVDRWNAPKLVADHHLVIHNGEYDWWRIRISNHGNQSARKSSVMIVPLDQTNSNHAEEILDLSWSDIGALRETIPSKTSRYIDVIRKNDAKAELLTFNNYRPLTTDHDKLFITAQNAKTNHCHIQILRDRCGGIAGIKINDAGP